MQVRLSFGNNINLHLTVFAIIITSEQLFILVIVDTPYLFLIIYCRSDMLYSTSSPSFMLLSQRRPPHMPWPFICICRVWRIPCTPAKCVNSRRKPWELVAESAFPQPQTHAARPTVVVICIKFCCCFVHFASSSIPRMPLLQHQRATFHHHTLAQLHARSSIHARHHR